MRDKKNESLVDCEAVAKLFGVGARRVQQLAQERVITGKKINGVYHFDALVVAQEYIQNLSNKLAGKENDERVRDLERQQKEAEVRLKNSRARKEELVLAELEGSMHRSEDVEAMTSDLANVIRSMLLALPGRLAVDLAEMQNPAEVSERVKREAFAILEVLAKYQYDPNEYRRRVRERAGWRELEGNGSED